MVKPLNVKTVKAQTCENGQDAKNLKMVKTQKRENGHDATM